MKVDLNDQYFFFLYILLKKKAFSSRLEICLQMSTKLSQNAPKCLIVPIIVIPLFFSICYSHLCGKLACCRTDIYFNSVSSFVNLFVFFYLPVIRGVSHC